MTSCVTEQPVNHEMTRRKTLALHRYYTRRVCSSGICCVLDDQKHRRTHTVYITQWCFFHIPSSPSPSAHLQMVFTHPCVCWTWFWIGWGQISQAYPYANSCVGNLLAWYLQSLALTTDIFVMIIRGSN